MLRLSVSREKERKRGKNLRGEEDLDFVNDTATHNIAQTAMTSMMMSHFRPDDEGPNDW